MIQTRQTGKYDLEDRTFAFAQRVRALAKSLPHTLANIEDSRQVIRSSGSVGANYIEANEALSKKDFLMRLKISRKEAKETHYFLRLLDTGATTKAERERTALVQEAHELLRIFSAIIEKSS